MNKYKHSAVKVKKVFKLSCMVGDTIYCILGYEIKDFEVKKIEIIGEEYLVYCGQKGVDDWDGRVSSKNYGISWFADIAEAKENLAMKRKKDMLLLNIGDTLYSVFPFHGKVEELKVIGVYPLPAHTQSLFDVIIEVEDESGETRTLCNEDYNRIWFTDKEKANDRLMQVF